MTQQKEQRNFLTLKQNEEILTTAKAQIDLNTIKADFGLNYNTFSILNTSTEKIKVYLDDNAIAVLDDTGGSFSIDARDNIIYSQLFLENIGSGTASADTIFITIGRTGF